MVAAIGKTNLEGGFNNVLARNRGLYDRRDLVGLL
jgi:hypothetical protein